MPSWLVKLVLKMALVGFLTRPVQSSCTLQAEPDVPLVMFLISDNVANTTPLIYPIFLEPINFWLERCYGANSEPLVSFLFALVGSWACYKSCVPQTKVWGRIYPESGRGLGSAAASAPWRHCGQLLVSCERFFCWRKRNLRRRRRSMFEWNSLELLQVMIDLLFSFLLSTHFGRSHSS